MANFRGYVKGTKGSVTRLGHKQMRVSLDSWDHGIEVNAQRDEKSKLNTWFIYVTGGSNGGESTKIVLRVNELENGKLEIIPYEENMK